MTPEILVKIYYPDGESEVRDFTSMSKAVSSLRGENVEIEYAIEVEPGVIFGMATCRFVTSELEALWLDTARAELEDEYRATNPTDITLEAFLDRAEGPIFRKPSVRSPKIYSGFSPKQILAEAAE